MTFSFRHLKRDSVTSGVAVLHAALHKLLRSDAAERLICAPPPRCFIGEVENTSLCLNESKSVELTGRSRLFSSVVCGTDMSKALHGDYQSIS